MIAPPVRRVAASFADATVEIVTVRLDAGPAIVSELARCLSYTERKRASQFVFDGDRRRFIVARAQLRGLLAVRLGVRPESVELIYGPRGKPALSRRFADLDLRFNLAHSEDVAAYAFARGREVGIDIEAMRVIGDADEIAARFFSSRENESYRTLDARDKPLGFFSCWTRKEAFIKALGDGLNYPLDRFDVSLAPGEPARILRIENTFGDACGWALHGFSLESGFVGAVVIRKSADELASKACIERAVSRSMLRH